MLKQTTDINSDCINLHRFHPIQMTLSMDDGAAWIIFGQTPHARPHFADTDRRPLMHARTKDNKWYPKYVSDLHVHSIICDVWFGTAQHKWSVSYILDIQMPMFVSTYIILCLAVLLFRDGKPVMYCQYRYNSYKMTTYINDWYSGLSVLQTISTEVLLILKRLQQASDTQIPRSPHVACALASSSRTRCYKLFEYPSVEKKKNKNGKVLSRIWFRRLYDMED